jgi:hypothetical protein
MTGFTPNYINILHKVYGHNTGIKKFASSIIVTFIYKQAVRIFGDTP